MTGKNTNKNRRAVPTDREYMTHWIDTRSAILNLDVTTVSPENTGNAYEFTAIDHTESEAQLTQCTDCDEDAVLRVDGEEYCQLHASIRTIGP